MIRTFNYLTDNCKNVRQLVFVEEQGFIEEFDDFDNECFHYEYLINSKCVATLRVIKEDGQIHIGRVAVLKEYRNQKIASKLIKRALSDFSLPCYLNSQEDKKGFYEKLGFKETGKRFYEQDVLHLEMINRN